MTLQDRVTQLLARQARKNEGYKIFVNGEQVKVDTPLKTEDEVFASIEMLLADEAVRPSIRVEDPDGKVIMNQDTARVSSDDCDVTIAGYNDYDSDDDDDDEDEDSKYEGTVDGEAHKLAHLLNENDFHWFRMKSDEENKTITIYL